MITNGSLWQQWEGYECNLVRYRLQQAKKALGAPDLKPWKEVKG